MSLFIYQSENNIYHQNTNKLLNSKQLSDTIFVFGVTFYLISEQSLSLLVNIIPVTKSATVLLFLHLCF